VNYSSLVFVLALALVGTTNVAAQRHDEKPHGTTQANSTAAAAQGSVVPAESDSKSIPLKDGGTLIIHSDGTVYHADASGRRVRMKNGTTMEAKDGTRYLMVNDAVWQAITQKGSLHPNHQ
jgi:hypothetical protein